LRLYVSRAAAVFVGRVAFTDHDPSLGLRQRTFVKFVVEEAFKGLSPETHEVWVDPGSFTSCYAEYSVGERLMVFAYGGQAICGRVRTGASRRLAKASRVRQLDGNTT
jgi:hypothetical protein